MNSDHIIHLSELPHGKSVEHSFSLSLPFKSVSFHYFRMLFNVGYWLLLVPFRCTEKDGQYYLHINKIQRVCFAVGMSCVTIYAASSLRLLSLVKIKENKAFLFELAIIAASIGFCVVVFYIYWFKTRSVSRILKICQNDHKNTTRSKKHTTVAFVLCLLSVGLALWHVFKRILLGNSNVWNELKILVKFNKYMFYVESNITQVTDENMTSFVTSVAVVILIVEIYWKLIISFLLLFCLFSAIMVNIISNEFAYYLRKVKKEKESSYLEKLAKASFYVHKTADLISAMNSMSGPVLIVFVLEAVPFFATKSIRFFETEDIAIRLETAILFSYYFVILFIAAAGQAKMARYKSWLFHLGREVDDDDIRFRLMYMSMEASTEQLGLDGGGFFFITFKFVGAMVSLFVTYAIILITL